MWILWVLCFSPPPDGELLGGKGCIWSTVSSDQHGLVLSKCIWKWWLEGGGGVTAKPLTDLSVCKSFLSKIYRNFFAQLFASLDIKKSNWENTWHNQNSASMVHGHWLSFPYSTFRAFVLLDPSAAFDTLPHSFLKHYFLGIFDPTIFFLSGDAFTVVFVANTPPWSY